LIEASIDQIVLLSGHKVIFKIIFHKQAHR